MFSPELELYVLMECAESPFGLGKSDAYRWHRDNPGESPTNDLVRHLECLGYLTVVEVRDVHEHRMRMQADITPTGRSRLNELARSGVKPCDGWL